MSVYMIADIKITSHSGVDVSVTNQVTSASLEFWMMKTRSTTATMPPMTSAGETPPCFGISRQPGSPLLGSATRASVWRRKHPDPCIRRHVPDVSPPTE